jgi:predicted RNA-binding Zn ribbon-like protein
MSAFHAHAARPAPFFIGDHLALDFLNTTGVPWGERIEWLGGGSDLVDWLEQAGALPPEIAHRFQTENDAFGMLDIVAEQARGLREWWRGFVERHQSKPLTARALVELQPLNQLLARDELHHVVDAAGSAQAGTHGHALRRRQERRWTTPERLLQPIADAISDLVCEANFGLVRICEGPACTFAFYDRTKSHARRWCSMAICGNRAKAAAHRARLREEAKGRR